MSFIVIHNFVIFGYEDFFLEVSYVSWVEEEHLNPAKVFVEKIDQVVSLFTRFSVYGFTGLFGYARIGFSHLG